jgi:uncharacterized damage-inducible protein DinB
VSGLGEVEAWLRGPVPGVPAELMPAAHALIDAREELEGAARGLSIEQLWARPAGVASVGFHLRHVRGATERLLTYARGEALSEGQLAAARRESEPGHPPQGVDELLDALGRGIEAALDALRAIPPSSLGDAREVGRKKLPSNVRGLVFHTAEHARRHAGQAIVTARVVRGSGGAPD